MDYLIFFKKILVKKTRFVIFLNIIFKTTAPEITAITKYMPVEVYACLVSCSAWELPKN